MNVANTPFIVSATLSGVETLKYPLFTGFGFSARSFFFFNIGSNIFSK